MVNKCDAPTGRCEEDSMCVNGDGPPVQRLIHHQRRGGIMTPPMTDAELLAYIERTQAWAKSFNKTLTALGHQQHDEGWLIGWFANAIMRGFDEAQNRAAPSSQPAQGEAATEKLQKLDAIIQETRDYLDMVEMLSEEPDLDRSDTLRLLGVLNDYRSLLAAAPAAPTQEGWQPIETAQIQMFDPKNWFISGPPVLLFRPNYTVIGIYGYTERGKGRWQAQGRVINPTHWMPLPPKPTNGEGA